MKLKLFSIFATLSLCICFSCYNIYAESTIYIVPNAVYCDRKTEIRKAIDGAPSSHLWTLGVTDLPEEYIKKLQYVKHKILEEGTTLYKEIYSLATESLNLSLEMDDMYDLYYRQNELSDEEFDAYDSVAKSKGVKLEERIIDLLLSSQSGS